LYDSYAVSQTVLVLDSGTSRIKRKIDCSAVGLREPRGLALTGDERYLIISDRWKRIFFYDCENEVFCKEKTCSSFNWMNSHISLSQN